MNLQITIDNSLNRSKGQRGLEAAKDREVSRIPSAPQMPPVTIWAVKKGGGSSQREGLWTAAGWSVEGLWPVISPGR